MGTALTVLSIVKLVVSIGLPVGGVLLHWFMARK